MHPNSAFRRTERDRDLAALRDRAFGVLTVSSDPVPTASHIPFIMPKDDLILGHIVRNSPMHKALSDGAEAMLIVSLGDSYVSPDWYGVEDQVPTWNYVAIHVMGHVKVHGPDVLPDTLAQQSATLEARLAPKAPWTADKMSEGVYPRMQRAILPIEMRVSDIQSTWKLSQNKPDDVRARTVHPLKEAGFGLNTDWVAEEMLRSLEQDQSDRS